MCAKFSILPGTAESNAQEFESVTLDTLPASTVLIGCQLVVRRRRRVVLRPFTFLQLASPLPPSSNRCDGVGHFSNFTTGFYYTAPNLELKKVTCGRDTDKNCCGTALV